MKFYVGSLVLAAVAFFSSCGTDETTAVSPIPPLVNQDTVAAGSIPSLDSSLNAGTSVFQEPHAPGFNPCQFNFGAAWSALHEEADFYRGLDYIAVWLGDNDFYNAFEARMVETAVSIKATPMIYAYVIAEFGKDHGLEDCDMVKAEVTHCTHGAGIIREYFNDSILYRYEQYAAGLRDQVESNLELDPNTFESIWLIEPDFYQYSQSSSLQRAASKQSEQVGGGIPDAEMGFYFSQIVGVIKKYLPAAKIAIDISPWIKDKLAWYSNFDLGQVDYASTSGGRTTAGSAYIRGREATWAEMFGLLGKPVLADAGYDAGGVGTGHAKVWDLPENINARIADGVVGVMQMDAENGYPARADSIRSQLLVNYPWCQQ